MFSLRKNLIEKQGVTLEESVKQHLKNCLDAIKATPTLRAHRYRVNPTVPNDATQFEFVS